MSAPEWTPTFNPFPTQDITAAKAWFSNSRNTDFSIWKRPGAYGESSKVWTGLEAFLETVSGVRYFDLSYHQKQACATVLGTTQASKKHATSPEIIRIGKVAGDAINGLIETAWKKEAEEWIVQTCTVLAKRSIHLWKKSLIGKASPVVPSDSGSTSLKTPIKRMRNLGCNNMPTSAMGESLLPVKRYKPAANKMRQTSLPIANQVRPRQVWNSLRLVERAIDVRLQPQGDMMDVDSVPYCSVSLAAIVQERALSQVDRDIRVQHLSFMKFRNILKVTNQQFDLSWGITKLTWCDPNQEMAQEEEIEDESDFQNAVAVLSSSAQCKGSEDTLRMSLYRKI
jgi:hypothetical protein